MTPPHFNLCSAQTNLLPALLLPSQIFPFFTYIPSSGLFGDGLSRVLFFSRIGADVVGRFAPRVKALVTRSPVVLLSLSLLKVGKGDGSRGRRKGVGHPLVIGAAVSGIRQGKTATSR